MWSVREAHRGWSTEKRIRYHQEAILYGPKTSRNKHYKQLEKLYAKLKKETSK